MKTVHRGVVVSEKRKGVIFCSYTGEWKDELEERLRTEDRVTLAAIGRIRYKLLAYLQNRKDMEIVKVETRYMKNRDKGVGIKVTVRKLSNHELISQHGLKDVGKLRERLIKTLAKFRDEMPSDKVACRQCVEKLIPFVREHKSIDKFEDFEFDEKCEIDTNKRGEKWCWAQIILLRHGKETASLVFKAIGREFTAEIVDLGSFEKNYGLFC